MGARRYATEIAGEFAVQAAHDVSQAQIGEHATRVSTSSDASSREWRDVRRPRRAVCSHLRGAARDGCGIWHARCFSRAAGGTGRARVARITHQRDHWCRRAPGDLRRGQEEEV